MKGVIGKMNNQQLKKYIRTKTNTLKNKLLKVIKEFPQGYDWNENHVNIAVNKLVENSQLSTEQVINCIKEAICVLVKNGLLIRKVLLNGAVINKLNMENADLMAIMFNVKVIELVEFVY
jgi:hypothetical protein